MVQHSIGKKSGVSSCFDDDSAKSREILFSSTFKGSIKKVYSKS